MTAGLVQDKIAGTHCDIMDEKKKRSHKNVLSQRNLLASVAMKREALPKFRFLYFGAPN